jgi:hypothetical protein
LELKETTLPEGPAGPVKVIVAVVVFPETTVVAAGLMEAGSAAKTVITLNRRTPEPGSVVVMETTVSASIAVVVNGTVVLTEVRSWLEGGITIFGKLDEKEIPTPTGSASVRKTSADIGLPPTTVAGTTTLLRWAPKTTFATTASELDPPVAPT